MIVNLTVIFLQNIDNLINQFKFLASRKGKVCSGVKHEGDNKRKCMLDIPVTQFRHVEFFLGVCFVWFGK